jgi:hypothetical protein
MKLELTLRGLQLLDWLEQHEGPLAGAFAEVLDAIAKFGDW